MQLASHSIELLQLALLMPINTCEDALACRARSGLSSLVQYSVSTVLLVSAVVRASVVATCFSTSKHNDTQTFHSTNHTY